MENFVVSARKYRPQKFEDVVGQSAITKTLQNAISQNHLAQAFLFCGPRGVGKTTCARILAKTINQQDNAEHPEDEDFSFNVFELDAASNNSVDDIRSLTDQVRFPPQVGNYKVYIIDEVHMLSQAAFNAFLKTLEEPPAHAIFILATTEKHKIIPTILSRCQIFDFKRIEVKDIVDHLTTIANDEGVTIEEKALHVIAQKADGALRDALSIFDQVVSFCGNDISYQAVIDNLNVLDYDYYFKVADAIKEQDVSQVLLIFDEILSKGFDGHNFITGLAAHFRDLLVCKDPRTLSLLEVSDDVKQHYHQQAKALHEKLVFNCLSVCSECDINYKTAKNQRLLVEFGLVKMCSLIAEPEKKNDELVIPDSKPKKEKNTTSTQSVVKVKNEEAENSSPETPKPKQKAPSPAQEDFTQKEPNVATNPPAPPRKDKPKVSSNPKPNPTGGNGVSTKRKLGLKNLLNQPPRSTAKEKVEADEEEAEPETPTGPEKAFTDKEVTSVWKQYLKKLKEEGSTGFFYNAMNSTKPSLVNNTEIHVLLKSATEEKEWKTQTPDLLAFLRDRLQNVRVSLVYDVKEEEANTKYYTNRDRFKRMVELNPKLIELKKRLDLELE